MKRLLTAAVGHKHQHITRVREHPTWSSKNLCHRVTVTSDL